MFSIGGQDLRWREQFSLHESLGGHVPALARVVVHPAAPRARARAGGRRRRRSFGGCNISTPFLT